ncbi:MAG: glycosyltransferase family 2 protein [Nitrospiraceae bacterium]|nr:MAG: glycosyltransferase family 2 protein [Nitrospiraceae bacterium]
MLETKLSVIVPCYNEEKNIPLMLDRFGKVIKRKDIEVILVNNGSMDNSQHVMESLLPGHPFARICKVEKNQGYGFGILSGLRSAKSEYLAWTHADMQTDPSDVVRALEIVESSAGPRNMYVKGRRQGRPPADVFFTWGMGVFESVCLGVSLSDINAQPNVFHRSFYELWKDPPYDFSLDLYAFYMARKNGFKVIRFPVLFPNRIHGHSHWNFGLKSKWKFIKRTLDFSIKLKKRLK